MLRGAMLSGWATNNDVSAGQVDQGMVTSSPPAFQPFRFEPRRARIDWRLLHGVDINNIVRDVDLDVLEKVVSIIAFGDIEAEDTRHLTELNFLKVFRLSQLIIEYLLYVQDCLQSTNVHLQQHRSQQEKYISAARLRVRELEAGFKTCKRELRHARKTVKTFETMAVMGKLGVEAQVVKTVAEPAPAPTPAPAPAPPPPPPAIDPAQVANAVELVLRKDLGMLSDRLTRAQLECQRMKVERDDMMISLREVEASMREHAAAIHNKSGREASELRAAREQLGKANTELRILRAEADNLASQLGQALAQKKAVLEEKNALLQDMSTRPAFGGGAEGAQLSAMLLDSKCRSQCLEEKVGSLEAEAATLRKQLMKSMKDAAASGEPLAASPPQQALADAQRTLQKRAAELEQQLEQQRRQHALVLEGLQGELGLYQQQAAELRQDLMNAKAAATASAQQAEAADVVAKEAQAAAAAATAAAQEAATRAAHAEMRGTQPGPELLALQGRNKELESAAQQLQAELQALKQHKQDLEARNADLAARTAKLDTTARAKDEQLADARRLVKELQAQLVLPSGNRDPGAVGRVKDQVEEFERIRSVQEQQQQQQQQQPIPPPFAPLHLDIPPPPSAVSSPFPARPGPDEAKARYHACLAHVASLSPDQLAVYIEENARIHTEKPFEYEEDDEAKFRHALPHEMPGTTYGGILSTARHTSQELQGTLQRHAPSLMAQLDDLVASFGMDPTRLTDLEYAGAMTELQHRWAAAVAGLKGSDAQGRAEFLRDALLTHLELVKRRTLAQKGKAHMDAPDPADVAALLAYSARVTGSSPARAQQGGAPVPPSCLAAAVQQASTSVAVAAPAPVQQAPSPSPRPPVNASPSPTFTRQPSASSPESGRAPQAEPTTPQQQPQQPQLQPHAPSPSTPPPVAAQPQPQQPQPSSQQQWRQTQEQQLEQLAQQWQQQQGKQQPQQLQLGQQQEGAQQATSQQQQSQQQRLLGHGSPKRSTSPSSTQPAGLQRSLSRSRDAPEESMSQTAKSRFAAEQQRLQQQQQQQQQGTAGMDASVKSMAMTSDVDDEDEEGLGDISLGLPVGRFTPAVPDSPPKPRPIIRQPDPDSDPRPGRAPGPAGNKPSVPPPRQMQWTDPPSRPETPASLKGDDDMEQASVHSWNPNETNASSPATTLAPQRLGRRAGTAAAAGGWAWESPDPTPREAAQKAGVKRDETEDWNETIKSIGISEAGDDVQGSDTTARVWRAQPVAGRRSGMPAGAQQQVGQGLASSKPTAASAMQRVLERNNSFDSVSELEV